MLKPVTIQRVQVALQTATQAVMGNPALAACTAFEHGQLITQLGKLMLEEDDRQNRTIIIPGRG